MKKFKLKDNRRDYLIGLPLALLICIFIFWLSGFKEKMRNDALQKGIKVSGIIYSVDCNRGLAYSTIYFRYNGKRRSTNLSNKLCKDYRVNDTIQVYYNQELQSFYLENDGLGYDIVIGRTFSSVAFIFLLGCFIYQLFIKKK
ncbi:hypothetical protein COR50_10320 [Chitinophaga caeni]|uniref:DUF3592 domain-containing protein n=1 Tax=Chitinophaga caeni TaxID=2029983 RepID=A0A291QU89_9BACT|nr:hypothetical protein [Chitinophaga caeni]ATL47530.1 hypothetical protein COR50_10320 [Chitinophaga caeni]